METHGSSGGITVFLIIIVLKLIAMHQTHKMRRSPTHVVWPTGTAYSMAHNSEAQIMKYNELYEMTMLTQIAANRLVDRTKKCMHLDISHVCCIRYHVVEPYINPLILS